MNTWNIKGLCENCGLAYMVAINSKDGSFPDIQCPQCHNATFNFDKDFKVDELNKEEGSMPDYNESISEIADSLV